MAEVSAAENTGISPAVRADIEIRSVKDLNKKWGDALSGFFTQSRAKLDSVINEGTDWRLKEDDIRFPEVTIFKPKLSLGEKLAAKLGGVKSFGISCKADQGFDLFCELREGKKGEYLVEVYDVKLREGFPKRVNLGGSTVAINIKKITDSLIPESADKVFTRWFQPR
jgi:hypothetical protein